ncbi:MAG: site-2 protease family protein [Acidobacteria bacterium]|nr:site-2 protease family protein [Acidobacteriota bacterium]
MSTSVIIAQIIAFAIAISFHEAAHAWSANKLGDPTARLLGRITMNPLKHIDPVMTVLFPALLIFAGLPPFGAAKPVPVDPRNLSDPRRDHAWIAAAGPISNVILAVGAVVLLRFVMLDPVRAAIPASAWFMLFLVLQATLMVNLILATFNMIPLPPLDGSWILSAMLPGPVAAFYRQLQPYGFVILIALMYTGALRVLFRPVLAFGAALAGF